MRKKKLSKRSSSTKSRTASTRARATTKVRQRKETSVRPAKARAETGIEFGNEQDAAKALLLDVCARFNRQTIDYAVIGGWIPYLFCGNPIPHPGTFDVDVVLNNALSKDAVVTALDELVIESGYRRAPKNAFQIYRPISVRGETMIFHVDFLHRKYADDTDSLILQWGRYESIQTAGTDTLFLNKEISPRELTGITLDGNQATIRIPFATEAGFLATKGRSVGFGKRTRDAYDIYLTLKQSGDRGALVRRCKTLSNEPIFRKSIERLGEQFQSGEALTQAAEWLLKMTGDEYLADGDPADPHTQFGSVELAKIEVRSTLQSFFGEAGFEYISQSL